MKYFSMFSGIGGFELGIHKAIPEAQCIGFSEIDKHAISIYKKHYPEVKNYGNATTINPIQLPDFDFLIGGFPCQSFSIAGKRRGFKDKRGTLFLEIARVLKAKQPRMFFLENVKGLLNHDKGETFTQILRKIDELGYNAEWQILNSKHYGVPQNRERVFIIGHLRKTSSKKIFPIKATSKEPDKWASSLQHPGHSGGNYKGMNIICHPTLTGAIGRQGSSNEYKRSLKSVNKVLMLRDGRDNRSCLRSGRVSELGYKGYSERRLTPVECERLQGFPDGWTDGISDTQRYKCLGNAVTVNVIEAIAEKLREIAQ